MDRITVETTIAAPLERVWQAYVTPEDIMAWNAADDSWHCPAARVDLREGGVFSSRMEAKDGSFGFDFEGTYTRIVPQERLEYRFGDRQAEVTFQPGPEGVTLRVTFDAETEFPPEQQRQGWQAILERFAAHVTGQGNRPAG